MHSKYWSEAENSVTGGTEAPNAERRKHARDTTLPVGSSGLGLTIVTDPYFLYDGSDTVYGGQAGQSMWPALMTWVTIYMFILAMDRELNQRNRIYYTDFSSSRLESPVGDREVLYQSSLQATRLPMGPITVTN